ncbi:MAG: mannose-1-phosphate guanylyltransferase [Micropruina sp.]|uniref:mannose-1-phosphate guanylyltransferase n=1 Tax=Micropruina sp. TaxID=2737536 RepID=UPI0039E6F3CD
MRFAVIMAGGSGTRLWPLSRKGTPKQLLRLIEGKSLLRIAFERLGDLVPPERVLVCTGAAYAAEVAAELPELPAENILGEPEGRDSLNAVAWPAAVIAERDPDAVIAQVTADQLIEPVAVFSDMLAEAFAVAEADAHALVTLGVVPTSAHTGYGYLRRGAAVPGFEHTHQVLEFREKPDLVTASEYLASGDYWWNAGMFVWQAGTFLEQLAALHPATHAAVLDLAAHPERLAEIFPTLHKTSVDYAIMEPVAAGAGTAHVLAVALPVQWRDVGGYASLAEILTHDAAGNALIGASVCLDASDNVIINTAGEGHLTGVLGCSGMVIVTTPTTTLVAPVDAAERVRELVALVRAEAGERHV